MLQQYVATAENNGLAYITEEFCDGRPATECWVESEGSGTACVPITYASVYSTIDNPTPSSAPTLNDRGNMTWTDPNGNVSFELPSFSNEILGNYSKKIDNKWYACTTYQISLANWNDVVNQFIEPAVCGANGFTYGTDCILDGEPVDISISNDSGQTSFYKWIFNVCKLDSNNVIINALPTVNDRGNISWTDPNGTLISVPRYHFIPSGIYSELLSTRYGFQTNAPDDKINEFVANFCHDQSEFWCSKESVSQPHSGGEPTLWIHVREHGYASMSSWSSTLGSYTMYATNEDDPVAYVLDKICTGYSSEDCYAVSDIVNGGTHTVLIFKKLIPETELPAPLEY